MNRTQLKSAAPLVLYVFLMLLTMAEPSFASFESSLLMMRTKLTTIILPLLSVIGLGFAALSFFTGNPNAKQHIAYAIFGCLFGFGAQAIVDFISQTVN